VLRVMGERPKVSATQDTLFKISGRLLERDRAEKE
jgi:hypothetical protein